MRNMDFHTSLIAKEGKSHLIIEKRVVFEKSLKIQDYNKCMCRMESLSIDYKHVCLSTSTMLVHKTTKEYKLKLTL